MTPENYTELKTFLNLLAGWLWYKVLQAQSTKEVIFILRRCCPGDLHGWTDEDLTAFFRAHSLKTFYPVNERF